MLSGLILGKRDLVDVKVTLPGGRAVVFRNVRADRFLEADLAGEKLSEVTTKNVNM